MYILQTLHCNTSITSYNVAGKRQNLNTGQIKSELQPAPVLSQRGWQEQRLLLSGQSQSNIRLGSQISQILQKEPTEKTIYGFHGDSLRYVYIIIIIELLLI